MGSADELEDEAVEVAAVIPPSIVISWMVELLLPPIFDSTPKVTTGPLKVELALMIVTPSPEPNSLTFEGTTNGALIL